MKVRNHTFFAVILIAFIALTPSAVLAAATAVNDTGATNEDTVLNVAAGSGVTTNDNFTNPPGEITAFDNPSTNGGVVTVNQDGSYSYDPNGQFESLAVGENTTDTFTYTVQDQDGVGGADTATVTITISGVNDAPTGNDDAGGTTNEDTAFNTANVLANDTDPDTSDTLTVSALDDTGTTGNVSDNGDGTFNYDPNGQFETLALGENTTDTFSYTVSDGNGGTDTATVTVTINGANDAPTANDDTGANFTTDEATAFNTGSVLTNDTDPDASDTLTVSALDDTGTTGNVSDNGDGTFNYDPNGQFETLAVGENATDTFSYTVSDLKGGTDTATVTVTINGVNDAPTGNDDSGVNFATDEDSSFTTGNVLTNDTDPDTSDTLSVSAIDTTGTTGNVTDNGDGTFTYDPNGQFETLNTGNPDTDSFSYTVSDGQGGTDTATVTIGITGVNDTPTVDTNTGLTVVWEDSTANPIPNTKLSSSDVDGDDTAAVLTYTVTAIPSHGTLNLSGAPLAVSGTFTQTNINNGDLTYDHDGSDTSSDNFKFRVEDDEGAQTSVHTFSISILPNYDLTVSLTGSGYVKMSPLATLDCGSGCSEYPEGTYVTLTPVPGAGWAFSEWGGALSGVSYPQTVTMNSDKTVSATFVQTEDCTAEVNQKTDGTAWTYLGTYVFNAGGKITLTDEGDGSTSFDAVKFSNSGGDTIIDDSDIECSYSGTWTTEACAGCQGGGHRYTDTTGSKLTVDVNLTGTYKVYARWHVDSTRDESAHYCVYEYQGHVITATKAENGYMLYKINGAPASGVTVETGTTRFPVSTGDDVEFTFTPHSGATDYRIEYVAVDGDTEIQYAGSTSTETYTFPDVAADHDILVSFISGEGGEETVTCIPVNQQADGTSWYYIGTYNLPSGTSAYVTLTHGGDGSVSMDAVKFLHTATSTETIVDNEDAACTYAPSADWTLDPTCMTSCYNGSHHFTGVQGDIATVRPDLPHAGEHDIFVRWTSQLYRDESASYCVHGHMGQIITAYAGPHGVLVSSGVTVESGATRVFTVVTGTTKVFTAIADVGYEVYDIYVDGSGLGLSGVTSSGVTNYDHTFTNIQTSHTIEAYFGDHGFDCDSATLIDCGSGTSGTILPAGDVDYFQVDIAGSGRYTFYTTGNTTDTYGTLLDTDCTPILTDDNSGDGDNFSIQAALDPGTYYIAVEHADASTGTGDYTVNLLCEHIIRATAHAGGSITPAGSIVVAHGADQSFTIAADSGNTIYDVEVDATSIGDATTYSFLSVTENHTIEALFDLPAATCNELSEVPMDAVVSGTPPIVMFVLDDSGSMDWEIMTNEGDGVFAGEYYVFDNPGDNLYSNSYILTGNQRALWKSQWSGYNQIYYNPDSDYVPWPTLSDADPDNPRSHPDNSTPTFNLSDTYYSVMPGIIIDNSGASFTYAGTWYTSGGPNPYGVNASWYTTQNGAWARWTPTFTTAGDYEVFVYYTDSGDRDSDAPYTVNHAGGSTTAFVDQDTNAATWVSIGTFTFNAGSAHSVVLTRYNNNSGQPDAAHDDHDSYTCADAVAFVPASAGGAIDIPRAHYYTFADLDGDEEWNGSASGETVYLVCLNSSTSSIDFYEVDASDDYVSSGDLWPVAAADVHPTARPKNKDSSYRTYAQERQSFANWYSFYRRRELTALAAISRTIYDLDSVFVGFRSINGSIKQPALPINVDGQNELNSLLTTLYDYEGYAYGTPLRRGFQYVGKYLDQEDGSTGDMGSGVTNIWRDEAHGGDCQQAFAIVMTDGYYNGSSPYVYNEDGNHSHPPYDGEYNSGVSPYSPYADNHSNTLADVAMYYYERDLVSGVTNNVPTNPYDSATHQHMVTYSVSFGLEGTLDQSAYETTSGTTNPPPWPSPYTNEHHKIDDLWHAAVNGRGLFLSAGNPDELVTALQDIFKNIGERDGSAASVSVNGDQLFAVLRSGISVYQAQYNSANKSGDVLAYNVDMSTFEVDTTNPEWSAADLLDDRINVHGHSDRMIATFSLASGGGGIPFRHSHISTSGSSEQMLYLTPDWSGSALATPENLINYLRGERTNEMENGGPFRDRAGGVMGEVVNSSPYYYQGVLYAGGNDGLLHAFDSVTGEELFAYVPGLVYENLKDYADPGYFHHFYVDLTPFVQPNVEFGANKKTVLMGGLRRGGMGYYALDISGITDTASFNAQITSETDLANRVLWEYPDSGTTTSERDNLGYSYSKAYIVKTNDATNAKWAAIFGNGYNSENSSAVLVILNATSGELIKTIDTGVTNCNGLSSPALVDIDSDDKVDYVYAGDIKGNLWKFDLTSTDYTEWGVAFGTDNAGSTAINYDEGDEPQPLFQAYGDTGPQPITTQPDIMYHCGYPNRPGYMVVFGTGKYMGEADITDTEVQTIYGIWDYGDDDDDDEFPGTFTRTPDADPTRMLVENPLTLETRTLLEQVATDYEFTIGGEDIIFRFLTDRDPDWSVTTFDGSCGDHPGAYTQCDPDGFGSRADPLADVGWFVDLPEPGERVINDLLIRVGILYSTTFTPTHDPCGGEGYSFPLFSDPCNGGSLYEIILDVDKNMSFDSADKLTPPGFTDAIPPSGRRMEGRLQRQVFVRTTKDGQAIDINIFSSSKGDPENSAPTLITRSPAMGVIYWKDLIN